MDKDQSRDEVVRFCEEQGIRLVYAKNATAILNEEGYYEISDPDLEILVEGNPEKNKEMTIFRDGKGIERIHFKKSG